MKTPLHKTILLLGAKIGLSRIFFSRIYSKTYPLLSLIKYRNPHFFRSISIETSTYCNRKCDYCPNYKYETPKKFMTEALFHKAIQQLKNLKFRGFIGYNHYNEPLLDARIYSFIRHAVSELPSAYHILFTNGDYLTEEKAEELFAAGIYRLIITNHNKNPAPLREKLQPILDKYGDDIVYYENLSESSSLNNRGGEIEHITPQHQTCPEGTQFVLTYTGEVILCCEDYHRKYSIGNLNHQSILEIWNSKKNKKIRKNLRKNIFTLPICKKCMGLDN